MRTSVLSSTNQARNFQEKLDKEADRLWDNGTLNQEKLDELRTEDLHKIS